MCRLFAFHSIIPSQVHSSLVAGDRSFMQLSHDHPDGWGVAYYLEQAPHVVKSESTAIHDQLFQRVSGIVTSNTVLAHLRKATHGQVNIVNTHPFQYGSWVFAHNGNIRNFSRFRTHLIDGISPRLSRFIIGDTDSEIIFFYILEELSQVIPLSSKNVPIKQAIEAVSRALKKLMAIVGPFSLSTGEPTETYLSFILTNGETILAHQGGQSLHYSSYKTRCPDRAHCKYFARACEHPAEQESINHLLFSSESIAGENVWLEMQAGDILGVDPKMKLTWGNSLASG